MYISSLPIWRSLFWQDDQIAAIRLINFCQLGDFYSVIFFYHHFKKKNRLKNRHLLFLLRIFFSLLCFCFNDSKEFLLRTCDELQEKQIEKNVAFWEEKKINLFVNFFSCGRQRFLFRFVSFSIFYQDSRLNAKFFFSFCPNFGLYVSVKG